MRNTGAQQRREADVINLENNQINSVAKVMVVVVLVQFTDVFFSYTATPQFIDFMALITSGFGGHSVRKKNLELSPEFQANCF